MALRDMLSNAVTTLTDDVMQGFNNVLDAQRSLLALEEALTVSRGEITQNLISLYKALGGGVSM